MPRCRRLTPEQEAWAVVQYERGQSLRQVADCVGLHHESVARLLRRAGAEVRAAGRPSQGRPQGEVPP